FEHRAVVVYSTLCCGAEQVSIGVSEQAATGTGSVAAAETEQGIKGVAAVSVDEFEHRAVTEQPTPWGGGEKVAIGVGERGATGEASVGAPGEIDQGVKGIAAVVVDEFDHRAGAVRSKPVCGAKQVALGVSDQAKESSAAYEALPECVQGVQGVAAVIVDKF